MTNNFFKFNRTFLLISSVLFLAAGCGDSSKVDQSGSAKNDQPMEKIYVAVEGEGKIAVIDAATRLVIKNISLSLPHEGSMHTFAPHNIQVAPDGKTVWVTANVGSHEEHSSSGLIKTASAHGEENEQAGMGMMEFFDQVIIIDPQTDEIIKRISIDKEQHLAHVALTPDSLYAYVTAQTAGKIYKINAKIFSVENIIIAPKDSGPHGLRISPDGSAVYIAMLKGKALGIITIKTQEFSQIALKGAAVQAGVTANGKYVLVSQYDTKAMAVYDTEAKQVQYVALPLNSKGPVQMYSTPDSRFVYIADQGYYFKQPTSEMVYKVDLEKMEVVKEIKVGTAPHGVVVSKDGKRVYVTNLLSKDVSIIDVATDQEVGFVKVGSEPNGISIWHKTLGGTP